MNKTQRISQHTRRRTWPLFLGTAALAVAPACSSPAPQGPAAVEQARVAGQTSFVSAPMAGSSRGGKNTELSAAAPAAAGAATDTRASAVRSVEETDLYRVEGDRLYFLNAYRGLMVFDISNIAAPRLLGRSPVYGSPVEMIVRAGVATIVLGDWYGTGADGQPFYGSVARGLDASDPTNIQVLGESQVKGWVRDTRVVGDVLYAVSEDYGQRYGWGYDDVAVSDAPVATGTAGTGGVAVATRPAAVVTSVNFAGRQVTTVSEKRFEGWSGVMNVSSNAIVFAHSAGGDYRTQQTELNYLDISDPAGAIVEGGSLKVAGQVQWGQDNGRWNLDYVPATREARILTQTYDYTGSGGSTAHLIRGTFPTAGLPTQSSDYTVPTSDWYIGAARFDGDKLYLAPSDYRSGDTTLRVLSLGATTTLAGTVSVPGQLYAFFPQGDRLFALGSAQSASETSSNLKLHYLNVANAAAPALLGSASFGSSWGWSAAASTFKAFANNTTQGLVALPFAGWDYRSSEYKNGVQVIEYTPSTITAKGLSRQRGWVERGVFVKGKIVSLSDQALSVVDYTDRANPRTVAELVLARNVTSTQVTGDNASLLSTDWWGNSSPTELTVLPKGNVENDLAGPAIGLAIPGDNARMLRAGTRGYVVTSVTKTVPCDTVSGGPGGPLVDVPAPAGGTGGTTAEPVCTARVPRVQLVDFSGATPVLRGSIELPVEDSGGYGWYGFGCYDWYGGSDEVLVGDDKLFFRRYNYRYDAATSAGTYEQKGYVVSAANQDALTVASTPIGTDPNGWWGNTRVVENTVYTTHTEWVRDAGVGPDGVSDWLVRYYLDRLDLTDPARPVVAARINVPGVMVGASETDASTFYFLDYNWSGSSVHSAFNVASIAGSTATLVASVPTNGYLGQVLVRGNKAYASRVNYPLAGSGVYRAEQTLVQLDLTQPSLPVITASPAKNGWGWLLDVQGDRAFVTSGWSNQGIDVYQLGVAAPSFSKFVRTRGWYANSLMRDGGDVYVSSGYYGVQKFAL